MKPATSSEAACLIPHYNLRYLRIGSYEDMDEIYWDIPMRAK
jgi:hypothetical protein